MIALQDVIQMLEIELELLEDDFNDTCYGERAKLLHKHYTRITRLLKKVE